VYEVIFTNAEAVSLEMRAWAGKRWYMQCYGEPKYLCKNNIMTYLTLSKFSTYNIDQILRFDQNTIPVLASFRLENGEPVSAAYLYLLYKKTFFCPYRPEVYYAKGKPLTVVVTSSAGRVFYLPAKEFAAIDLSDVSDYQFKVKEVPPAVLASKKAFAGFLGL